MYCLPKKNTPNDAFKWLSVSSLWNIEIHHQYFGQYVYAEHVQQIYVSRDVNTTINTGCSKKIVRILHSQIPRWGNIKNAQRTVPV